MSSGEIRICNVISCYNVAKVKFEAPIGESKIIDLDLCHNCAKTKFGIKQASEGDTNNYGFDFTDDTGRPYDSRGSYDRRGSDHGSSYHYEEGHK